MDAAIDRANSVERVTRRGKMTSRWAEEKQAVVNAARELHRLGLVTGTSGNVSVKLAHTDGDRDLIAITPLGKPYDTLGADDVVVVDLDVEQVEGELTPSSETLMHASIYRVRPDVGAAIHTHSVFCSVASVAGLEIPPIIDEMMIAVGGTVKVSDYAFPGTQELADNVYAALEDRNAALIRNHGAIGVGCDLREALNVCALVERAAQVFIYASMLGKVNQLPADAVETELAIYQMRRQVSGEVSQ